MSRLTVLLLIAFMCTMLMVSVRPSPIHQQPLNTDVYLRFRRNAQNSRPTRADEYVQPFIRFRKNYQLPYDVSFDYVPYMTRI
uniref:Neuropeptide-Like Protein n=2 Tax=Bursaphelenchus xylophilus TaxID=6326 RepID=A0A1I7RHU6_BURXY